MNINGFSCKNELHTRKYIVKGLIADKNKEKLAYCLLRSDNKKYFLNISLNPLRIYNLMETENFEIDKLYFTPDTFYKPLGYMQADFYILRGNPVKLRSNMFLLTETKENFEINFTQKDRFFKIAKSDFLEHLNDQVWVPDKAIVHDGKMHMDDILCISLLKYINPSITYERTRNIPNDYDGIVCDVGEGRYDHHNLDKFRLDDNGQKIYLPTGEVEVYCAFGLLAKDILPGLIGEKSYNLVDQQIIRSIDASDNYGTHNDLAYFFNLYNPAWNEDKTSDEAFDEAVEIGIKFISEIVKKELARQAAIPYVQSKISKASDDLLILDKRVPWVSYAKKSSLLFTIYPTDDGLYALQAIPKPNCTEKTNKIDLPNSWFTNPPNGCLFVHKSLFFATFKTLNDAIEAGKIAIKNGNSNL